MPDGMTFSDKVMLPIDNDEFDALSDAVAEMLGEAGAIFNESLHRGDIGDAISEVGQNVRGAQKRAWFPDPDFVEVVPVQDVNPAFGEAAHDPHADDLDDDELIMHDTLEAH